MSGRASQTSALRRALEETSRGFTAQGSGAEKRFPTSFILQLLVRHKCMGKGAAVSQFPGGAWYQLAAAFFGEPVQPGKNQTTAQDTPHVR